MEPDNKFEGTLGLEKSIPSVSLTESNEADNARKQKLKLTL